MKATRVSFGSDSLLDFLRLPRLRFAAICKNRDRGVGFLAYADGSIRDVFGICRLPLLSSGAHLIPAGRERFLTGRLDARIRAMHLKLRLRRFAPARSSARPYSPVVEPGFFKLIVASAPPMLRSK